MAAVMVALGALTGWFAHPWLMGLAGRRAPEGVDPGALWWLNRILITAGSAGAGLIWFAELPVVLRIIYIAAGILAWWLLCFDVALHKLPDPLVAALTAVVAGGYLLLYITDKAPLVQVLIAALAGALGLAGFGALAIARRSAMGLGDVKLAGALGLATGWYGLGVFLQWLLASFLLGGSVAAVLLLTRRVEANAAIAFGPWMLLGAAGVIVLNTLPGMTH